jgi:hypothetical protein
VSPDGVTQINGYSGSLPTGWAYSGTVSGSVGFTFNDDFLMTSKKVNTSSPITLAYDNDGLIVSAGDQTITRNTTTGFATKATLADITENYAYSALYGELSSTQGKHLTSNLYKAGARRARFLGTGLCFKLHFC